MKVFVSHSNENRSWARAIASALRDENVTVWLAEWDLKPGDNLVDEIERALRTSDVIVAVISGDPSENRNVFFELGAALGANKRLILVGDPSSADSIPFDLQQRRWVALQAPEDTAREVAEAVSAPG